MIMIYTGIRAEHVVNGVTNIVIKRSFGFSILRADMIDGIAQSVPDTKGTTDLPLNPNGFMMRSIKNTTLLIYPVSSKMDIIKNKIAICATNINTSPNAGKIQSAISSIRLPAGNVLFAQADKSAITPSTKSIGKAADANIKP